MSITAASNPHPSHSRRPQPRQPRRRPVSSRILASFLASALAMAGFTASSCAAPRLPPRNYPLRSAAGGYEMQVLLDGAPAQTYQHAGQTYILGQLGARYTLRVVNHTGRRVEAVASVDGRDAMDGKPADVRIKRGYVIPAWGSVDIDGWRLSHAEVAAFRFSSVADSYAARTGSAREVGVIGVAVFPERMVPPPHAYYAPPIYPRQQPSWGSDGHASGGPSSQSLKKSAPASGSPSKGEISDSSLDGLADASPSNRGGSGSAAPAPAPSSVMDGAEGRMRGLAPPSRRPGLGTEFGEAVSSRVQDVSFTRANAINPAVVLGARYNDREGLLALGINVDSCCGDDRDEDLAWRQSATPFPASDRGYAAPPAGWQRGCCMGY